MSTPAGGVPAERAASARPMPDAEQISTAALCAALARAAAGMIRLMTHPPDSLQCMWARPAHPAHIPVLTWHAARACADELDHDAALQSLLTSAGADLGDQLVMGYAYFTQGSLKGLPNSEQRRSNVSGVARAFLQGETPIVLHEEELELQNKLGWDTHFHVISFGFKSEQSLKQILSSGAGKQDVGYNSTTFEFEVQQELYDRETREKVTSASAPREKITLCVCAADDLESTRLFKEKQWILVRAALTHSLATQRVTL